MYADFGNYSLENKELANMDRDLEKITGHLTRDFKDYLKKTFQKIFPHFSSGNPTLTFVIDANIIIQEIPQHAKNGKSGLLTLIDSCPFLNVISPPKSKEEVFSKLDELSIKKKISKDLLESSANAIFKRITIQESDIINQSKAHIAMDSKDPDDSDYVALYFSANADGILTKDAHFNELPEVKTWSVKDMGKVLTRVENGSWSMVIVGNVLPLVLQLLYEATIFVLKLIFEMAILFLSIVTKLLSTPIVLGILFMVVINAHANGTLEEMVEKIVSAAGKTISMFANAIKSVLEFVSDILQIGSEQVRKLVISIMATVTTYQSLRASTKTSCSGSRS